MIDRAIQTPTLNSLIVFNRDVVTCEENGSYIRRVSHRDIDYCINDIEYNRAIQFRMSPYNRGAQAYSDPYIQDTRDASVLKGALIVVADKHNMNFELPANRLVVMPDLSLVTRIVQQADLQQPSEDNQYNDYNAYNDYRSAKYCDNARRLEINESNQELFNETLAQIKSADYVVINYDEVYPLSVLLNQCVEFVEDCAEDQFVSQLGLNLGYNAFANPQFKSIIPSIKKGLIQGTSRLSIAKILLRVTGTIFKQVVYYQIPYQLFRGTVIGQLHYVTFTPINVRKPLNYRRSDQHQADIVTHKCTNKFTLAPVFSAMQNIQDMLSQVTQSRKFPSLIGDAILDMKRHNSVLFCDASGVMLKDTNAVTLPIRVQEPIPISHTPQTYTTLSDDLKIRTVQRNMLKHTMLTNEAKKWEEAQIARFYAKNCTNGLMQAVMEQWVINSDLPSEPPQKLDYENIEQRIDEICFICMDTINTAIVAPCSHVVCSKCFPLLQPITQCPMCRREYQIGSYLAVPSPTASQTSEHANQDQQPLQAVNANPIEQDAVWGNPPRKQQQQYYSTTDQTFALVLNQQLSYLNQYRLSSTVENRLSRADMCLKFYETDQIPRMIPNFDLTDVYESEIVRYYKKMKHIVIPMFNLNRYVVDRYAGNSDTESILIYLGIAKGSAVEFITIDSETPQKPTMPITVLFINDEQSLLNSYIMNEGIQEIQHVIITPLIDLSQYVNSEFCIKLCNANVQQTIIKPTQPSHQINQRGYHSRYLRGGMRA